MLKICLQSALLLAGGFLVLLRGVVVTPFGHYALPVKNPMLFLRLRYGNSSIHCFQFHTSRPVELWRSHQRCHLLVEIQYYNLLALPLWTPCLSELKNMATRGRCFSASPNICSRIIMMTRGCSTVPPTVFIHSVRGSGLDWFTPSLHRMQL